MGHRTLKVLSTLFIILSFAALVSCVNNDYDLTKDIDMTVSIGGSEFAIPGGKTEEITLGKVLELDDEDLVKTDEKGNYYLEQAAEEPMISTIEVESFIIPAPFIEPIDLGVDIPNIPFPVRADLPNIPPIDFPEANTEFNFSQTGLPVELKTISSIRTDMKTVVTLSYTNASIKKATLTDVVLTFPEYIISEDLTNHKLSLPDVTLLSSIQNYSKTITIQGIDCSKLKEGEGLDGKTHSIKISGEISITGKVNVNASDITLPLRDSRLELKANINMNTFTAKSVTGKVDPEITITADPIKLNNLPDFLSDNETHLDVENPMIFITINNGSPLEANITGTLSPYKDGKLTITNPINFSITDISGKSENTPATDQRFCLSPIDPKIAGVKHCPVPDLSSLINKIPDEIRFNIIPKAADKEVTVDLGKPEGFTFKTDYKVNVPFVFGDKLSIVYKDTIDGWMEDLEDFEIQLVHVTGTVINKIPLALSLTAEPTTLNSKGEAIKLDGVEIKVKTNGKEDDNTITTGNEQGTSTALIIEMKETKAGSMKKLDGIVLRAVAKSSQAAAGKQLNKNQSVQLIDLKLKVPGGVKVDLNK